MNAHNARQGRRLTRPFARVLAFAGVLGAGTALAAGEGISMNGGQGLRLFTGAELAIGTDPAPEVADLDASYLGPAVRDGSFVTPKLDFSVGVSQPLLSGLSLDAGVRQFRFDERGGGRRYAAGRQAEYFLGVSYKQIGGRVWYTNPDEDLPDQVPSTYYEARWSSPDPEGLTFSMRVGRYDPAVRNGLLGGYSDISVAARKQFHGYGFGLRLTDTTLGAGKDGSDIHLMGSISKRFP